jgi:seryl-tRNA synthetase
MIDIKLLRENPEKIQKAAKDKRIEIDVQHILEIDERYNELSRVVQALREERNVLTKSIQGKPTDEQLAKGKELRVQLEKEENALNAVKEELDTWLGKIPNPAKDDVKVGKDDTENDVIRTFKEPTKFSFTPNDHLELGEKLDMIDMERAAKVSGARFAYLKNDGVLLELAIVQFALSELIKEGFTPVIPPVLIKRDTMQGLGYMENGGEEDMFALKDDDMFLVGTAEHALVPMHRDEILSVSELPKRYVGFSSAFRREAGSYGKDTRGILRVHQFDKVEMVSFVPKGKDDEEHEYLLNLEEKFFQALDIPYQVVKMCTGDLGFPAARKYDIEAWMPAQEKFREVTSVSTVTDFQSRRLKIRYRDGDETEFAEVLNGTAFAIGRTLIAILENYQQDDGSVVVPEVLRKYIGKDKITPRE